MSPSTSFVPAVHKNVISVCWEKLSELEYGWEELMFTPALFALKHYAMQIKVLAQECSDEILWLYLLKKLENNLQKSNWKKKNSKKESSMRGRKKNP